MEYMSELNKESFIKTLQDNENLLVDFWAPWNEHCKINSKILEDISHERNDVKILKINIDESKDIASEYGVKVVPSIIFFKKGKPIQEIKGITNKRALNDFIEKNKK